MQTATLKKLYDFLKKNRIESFFLVENSESKCVELRDLSPEPGGIDLVRIRENYTHEEDNIFVIRSEGL